MADLGSAARGSAAEPGRSRLFAVAVLIIVLSVIGFVLAFLFQWPSDFVLGDEPDARVTLGDLVQGTVTSIPLAPFVVLVVATLLVRSRRWWGTLAAVLLALLGGVFTVGGLGEIASDNANVPKAVLVVAGATYVFLGLTLFVCGIVDLVGRWRSRRVRTASSTGGTVV
ncbi:MAG: hypothetical protein ACLGH4_05580 [Actinomycetes bacterium]